MKAEARYASSGCPFALTRETTLADPSVLANAKDLYYALRHEKGVHFDPKLQAYIISRYEDLNTVLRDLDSFSLGDAWGTLWSEDFKEIVARDGGGWFPDAIMTDPPDHTRVRKLVERAFTPHRIKQLEPAITDHAVALLEKIAARGEADGVHDFAAPLTILIVAEQLGIKDVDPDTITRWTQAFTAQIGRMLTREEMIENAKVVCECQLYLIDAVRQRQASPSEDLISDLVHARTEGDDQLGLSFDEIVASSRAVLLGGNESINNAIANLLLLLTMRPDIAEQLYESVEDSSYVNTFVEELLRLMPPARATARIATRDVEVSGTLIPEGALVITMFASADDDETVFECPREFDRTRPNLIKHMSFGAGIHRCVGLALARMEVQVVAREVVKMLKDIRLTIPLEDIPFKLNTSHHSIENLPLAFSRR